MNDLHRQRVIAHLPKSGNDLRVVQVSVGHKRTSATETYKHTGLEQLKAIIDKLHHEKSRNTKSLY